MLTWGKHIIGDGLGGITGLFGSFSNGCENAVMAHQNAVMALQEMVAGCLHGASIIIISIILLI